MNTRQEERAAEDQRALEQGLLELIVQYGPPTRNEIHGRQNLIQFRNGHVYQAAELYWRRIRTASFDRYARHCRGEGPPPRRPRRHRLVEQWLEREDAQAWLDRQGILAEDVHEPIVVTDLHTRERRYYCLVVGDRNQVVRIAVDEPWPGHEHVR